MLALGASEARIGGSGNSQNAPPPSPPIVDHKSGYWFRCCHECEHEVKLSISNKVLTFLSGKPRLDDHVTERLVFLCNHQKVEHCAMYKRRKI